MPRCLIAATLSLLMLANTQAVADDTATKVDEPQKAVAAKPIPTVASITMKGAFPESSGQQGLLGQVEQNLLGFIARLDRAAEDDSVAAVVLHIRNPSVGRGQLSELRAAIGRTRLAKKKVIAVLHMASTSDYLLACACDEIVMPESGTLMMPGVRTEVMFYKGLFDKLGIQADMMQVGSFKGAAEPYTRTGMSDAFRNQYELLVDDIYDQLLDDIAGSRPLEKKKVAELIDIGLFSATDAKQAGLIDAVAYDDELNGNLKQQLAADSIKVVKDYGKQKVDTDFSGMMGMMKMIELMMGVQPAKRASNRRKIAVVFASGTIMTGESTISLFGGQVLGSRTIVKALREAAEDKTVVAIVLRVDSPGGSALASDLMWREIQTIEKPIFASMGDVAASGGYYISMGCDRIFAEPGTLTGSIGVVGGKMATKGLYDKVGLTTDVISRGKNSGLLSGDSPFTDSERVVWKKSMEATYEQFVGKAAQGRKLKREQMDALAGGRVWTGRQAQKNGLVDELGTLRDAIAHAKKAGGIAGDEKAELLLLPEPANLLDQLLGMDGGLGTRVSSAVDAVAPGAATRIGEVEAIRQLFSEPSVLIMPYRIDIR